MPQTVEEWQYLYGLAERRMLEDKETISKLHEQNNRLGVKVNNLRERLKRQAADVCKGHYENKRT